jgi:hypothetical protein
LSAVLERVNPAEVYLFAQKSAFDTPKTLLERLAGLVKYAQKAYDGKIDLVKLAGITGQREETIRTGLLWLAAKGYVHTQIDASGGVLVTPGGDPDTRLADQLEALLKAQLAETAAYRDYYRQAAPRALVGR